jgi:hypothetical protein
MSILHTAADYMPFVPKPRPQFVTENGNRVHGLIAEYESSPAVFHAAEKIRDAGYKKWDVHAPFPIHGIEHAMGHKKTILPYIVFSVGLGGAFVGWLMQYWMTAVDYTGFTVQGKPFGAWEPFTMIIFELGVLHAAFAALIGMLMLNGLPRWNHPLFSSDRFLGTSQGRFIIGIEATDKSFDPEATRRLLEETGGTEIEIIEDQD